MLDIPSISAVVAAVGVLVGVAFTYLEVRNLTRQRQTDLTMRLHSTWISEEMLKPFLRIMNLEFKDYSDFEKRYGSFLSENPEQIALTAVINHFEAVGYLMQRGMIDTGLVDLMPVSIAWKKIKPIVEGFREQVQSPRLYETFEYLHNEMKRRRPETTLH